MKKIKALKNAKNTENYICSSCCFGTFGRKPFVRKTFGQHDVSTSQLLPPSPGTLLTRNLNYILTFSGTNVDRTNGVWPKVEWTENFTGLLFLDIFRISSIKNCCTNNAPFIVCKMPPFMLDECSNIYKNVWVKLDKNLFT